MTQILGVSPTQIFREIIIVVIGILIAFALNAWWSGVQQKNEEQLILEGLHHDFEDNLRKIKVNLLLVEHSERLIESGLSSINQNIKDLNSVRFDSLIVTVMSTPIFDPVDGTLKDILSSGKLNVISNHVLRHHLSARSSHLQKVKEIENSIHDFINNQTRPFLIDKISITEIMKQDSGTLVGQQSSQLNSNTNDLLNNLQFENILGTQHYYISKLYENYLLLEAEVQEILKLITQSMN